MTCPAGRYPTLTACASTYIRSNPYIFTPLIDCPSNCATCTNSSHCQTCNSGYGLVNNQCATCPAGHYPTPTSCESTFFFLYNNMLTLVLLECLVNCASCTNSSVCLICNNDYGLYNGQCTTCPSGNYLSGSICKSNLTYNA